MKQEALKKIIKQAVREAIQEEIKDILLEAVRTPKQTVIENVQPKQQVVEGPSMSSTEKRAAYQNILGDMGPSFNSQHVEKPLQLRGAIDTTSAGASLPEGNVSMDQIMNLMSNK